jgi:hypothetical protein
LVNKGGIRNEREDRTTNEPHHLEGETTHGLAHAE